MKRQQQLFQQKTVGTEGKLKEELEEKGTEVVLERIEANRKKCLEILEKSLDDLENREELYDPESEKTVKNIVSALKATLLGVEALDSYFNLIAHDISFLGHRNDQTNHNLFQAGSHLQVLMAILIEKGYVTKEEMEKAWKKIIPEAVKDIQEAVTGSQADQAS